MRYLASTCVWEVTRGSNKKSMNDGSFEGKVLPDELTTEEAQDVCEQIADVGVRYVTLLGGEPLTRGDLLHLVRRLASRDLFVNVVTNGLLLDNNMAGQLKESGISMVSIIVEGTESVNDQIHRGAFAALESHKIRAGVVTDVTKQDIDILGQWKNELIGIETSSREFGILANGDIVTGTSNGEDRLIKGNIREQPLNQIL